LQNADSDPTETTSDSTRIAQMAVCSHDEGGRIRLQLDALTHNLVSFPWTLALPDEMAR
jgi:hypothetical protein